MIAPNLIIPFDGAESEIPSGWERDNRFNDRFPRGSTSLLTEVGGSVVHDHEDLAHQHLIGPHTHSGQTQLAHRDGDTATNSDSAIGFDHRHNYNGDGRSATNCQSTSIDTEANNLPEFYEVIFIKADSWQHLPSKAVSWNMRDKRPLGFSLHESSANRFLKGAAAGSDAGGTGGSNVHTHILNHTHTPVAHTHAITTARTSNGNARLRWDSFDAGNGLVTHYHTHVQTLSGSIQNMNPHNATRTGSNVPVNKEINTWFGGGLVSEGDIAITCEETNPHGWVNCDGQNNTPNLEDCYIRNTNTIRDRNDVRSGGAWQHTHDPYNHGHTGNGTHTHGDGGITNHTNGARAEGNGRLRARATRQHNQGGFTCSGVTANYADTNVTFPNADNEPPFIRVRFIMATISALGGSANIYHHFL